MPELHCLPGATSKYFRGFRGGGARDVSGIFISRIFIDLLRVVGRRVRRHRGYPDNPVDVTTDLALKGYFDASAIAAYHNMLPGDPARAALRNEIIYGRVAAYDVEFTDFQQKLNRERLIPTRRAISPSP